MLIAKQQLVETFFLCNESDLDHVLTAFYYLHGEHYLHLVNGVLDGLNSILAFIQDFIDTVGVSCSVESKLDIVFFSLEHNADYWFWLVNFNDIIVSLPCYYFMDLRHPYVQVYFVVLDGVDALCQFYSVLLESWNICIEQVHALFLKVVR